MAGNNFQSLLCNALAVGGAAVGRHAASVFVKGGSRSMSGCQRSAHRKCAAFMPIGIKTVHRSAH